MLMSWRYRQNLHILIAVPVAVAILGAFILSALAFVENLRFFRSTNQILGLVDTVRTIADQQKSMIFTPGDDIWEDLIRFGQIPSTVRRTNSWTGFVNAFVTAALTMRIESQMPAHDCRRMATYFLSRQLPQLGILAIEGQNLGDKSWISIYPPPANVAGDLLGMACGGGAESRLALVFRIK
jgi:hypothetical protein